MPGPGGALAPHPGILPCVFWKQRKGCVWGNCGGDAAASHPPQSRAGAIGRDWGAPMCPRRGGSAGSCPAGGVPEWAGGHRGSGRLGFGMGDRGKRLSWRNNTPQTSPARPQPNFAPQRAGATPHPPPHPPGRPLPRLRAHPGWVGGSGLGARNPPQNIPVSLRSWDRGGPSPSEAPLPTQGALGG